MSLHLEPVAVITSVSTSMVKAITKIDIKAMMTK